MAKYSNFKNGADASAVKLKKPHIYFFEGRFCVRPCIAGVVSCDIDDKAFAFAAIIDIKAGRFESSDLRYFQRRLECKTTPRRNAVLKPDA